MDQVVLCAKCDVPLVPGENWAPSRITRNHKICASCSYKNNLFNREARFTLDPVKERCIFMRRNARASAGKRKLAFNISVQHLMDIAPQICPVFGEPLEYGNDKGNPHVASLDRIVPELGYVKGNVQIISFLANRMKSDASQEQLEKFADWVKKPPVTRLKMTDSGK